MQQTHQYYYQHTATTNETIGGAVPEHIHACKDERDRLRHSKLPGPELVIKQTFHGCFERLDLLPGRTYVSNIFGNS